MFTNTDGQQFNITNRSGNFSKTKLVLKTTKQGMLVWFLIGILLLLSSLPVAKAQQSFDIDLPVLVNGAYVGDINASIVSEFETRAAPKVSVAADRLQTLLVDFAIDEQLSQWFLKDNLSGEELYLSELRKRGLEIDFDPGLLNISARVKLLGLNKISLRGNREPVIEDSFKQAKFASGINFFASNNFTHQGGVQQGFGDTAIDIAGFTTIGGFGGWSLFYEADYLQNDAQELARQDVTLIHDDYEKSIRYSIGDISPETSGLQSAPELLGVNIERDYQEINPFRNINPRGRSNFTLDRAAEVSFEVNGVIVDVQNLEPGRYSISDFPLISGVNDVRVIVNDGTSRIEVANFSSFADFSLLDQGVSDFGLSLGVERQAGTGRSVRYESEPVLVGFYERGITQKLTLGGQVEITENHALIGSTAIYGSRIGLIGIDSAISNRDDIGTGYSALLRHDFRRRTKSNWLVNSDLQFSYTSDNFVNLGDDTANGENWIGNAFLSLSKNGLGLSLGVAVSESNDLRSTSLSTGFFKDFASLSLSVDYTYTQIENEGSDSQFLVAVRGALGRGSSARSRYDSQLNEFSLAWDQLGTLDAGVGQIESVEVSRNDISTDLDVIGTYVGSRFEIAAAHSTSVFRDGAIDDLSVTDLSIGGAIGFADGKFAYGRPFSDGFLIVDRHKTLRGNRISVGSQNGGNSVTSTRRLNSTLVPIDRNYIEQSFNFDVEDLPVGYDIGSGNVKLFPGNLAGYRYTIGSDASNIVLGNISWPDNTPLNLKSGKLVPLGGGNEVTVFTNRTGRFVAEKIAFGKYKMIFTRKGEPYSLEIELTDTGQPGLIKAGDLILEKEQ